MTPLKTYSEQLKISAVSLRFSIPELVSQAVVNRLVLIKERSTVDIPESIMFATSFDEEKFISSNHLANVKNGRWQLEIVSARKKFVNEEVIIAIINKVGSVRTKTSISDHRNGNNPIRNKANRR